MTKGAEVPSRILSVKNYEIALNAEAAFKGFGTRDVGFVIGLSGQLAKMGAKLS